VLCFHGPLIYEAKVLKAEKKEKEWTYLIHYAGWSKRYIIIMSTDSTRSDFQMSKFACICSRVIKITIYSSWDDFVPESRLLKYNEENLKRQKDHKAALSTST